MFEMMDPYGEAEIWASFVPPVPPDDDELVCVDDLDAVDADECDGSGVLPDPELDTAAARALAEFEESLEVARLAELDADATLAEVAGNRERERRVQARRLWLAAHWADLHAVLTRPGAKGKGRERLIRLGGDGTPEITEFAPAELGAVLGMGDHAAKGLVADALDLRHRFPRLWQAVLAGQVDGWIARRTVQEARSLTLQAAAKVDQRVDGVSGGLTWRRLRHVVAAAILAADPPTALSAAERAAAGAGVFLDPEVQHGYQTMIIRAAAGDIKALDQALDLIARALRILGDTRSPEQRRAAAVGIIADPHAARDLLARAEQLRQAQRDAAAARRTGDTEAAERIDQSLPCPGVANQRPFVFTTAVLYYHLSKETLDAILAGQPYAGAGVVRAEDIGPVILEQVKQWLGHANVVLKPVINLPGLPPVDHYETPPAMSEAIGLIRSADSWPYGTCTSRHQDNEHTTPHVPIDGGGPPGQTDPLKMSKMTRGHHRIKTLAGWTVTQIRPGAWLYRSPHRYSFLVDQHGTTPLGRL